MPAVDWDHTLVYRERAAWQVPDMAPSQRRCPPRRILPAPPHLLCCPQLVPGVTYLELMEHVRQLYPAIGHFVLKFVDK